MGVKQNLICDGSLPEGNRAEIADWKTELENNK